MPEGFVAQFLGLPHRLHSAAMSQNWIFMVVREEAQHRKLAAVYRKASDEVRAIYAARGIHGF